MTWTRAFGIFVLLAADAGLLAQATWIVNPGGGPGVHFVDLPPAVAAASSGDTIVVQWGPFATGVNGFSTGKGLTIVSHSRVHLYSRVTVQNLPTGETFRLVGFEAPRWQQILIDVLQCSGEVHLEDLHALEPGYFFPSVPSIRIHDSALVTMLDVEDFGWPAVELRNSTAVMNACRLGITSIGLGGGPCLHATDATVDIIEPMFQTGFAAVCITSTRSDLRIGGTGLSLIQGGSIAGASIMPGIAISTHLGSVTVDPAVQLVSTPLTIPPVTGTAVVNVTAVPSTMATRAVPGQILTLSNTAPANSVLGLFVGLPGPLTPVPFGSTLLLQPPAPIVLHSIQTTVPAATLTATMPIPVNTPAGFALAAQSLVITPSSFLLGLPCQFVVH